jgi:hypothetical protein
MLPAPSTATHSARDGQETPLKPDPRSTPAELHALGPSAGRLDVSTFPEVSDTPQNDVVGHETLFGKLLSPLPASTSVAVQADASPVGFVAVKAVPLLSTAAQNVVEAQEIPAM